MSRVSARFLASEHTARLARRACGPVLPLVGDRADDLQLLVSELVTNSVRHAGVGGDTDVWLDIHVGPRRIRVEVGDRSAGFETPPAPGSGAPSGGGWGLVVVNQLCERWGIADEAKARVWAEMPYRPRMSEPRSPVAWL